MNDPGVTEEQIQRLVESRDGDGVAAAIETWRAATGRLPADGLLVAADAVQHGAGRLLEQLSGNDGGFDRIGFNAAVRHLSFYGLGDLAAEVVDEVEARGLLPGDDLRLENAKLVIAGVRERLDRFEELAASGDYELVRLLEARDFERRPLLQRLPAVAEADLTCYQTSTRTTRHPSTFERDFAALPAAQRATLRAAGFDRGHTETEVERVFLARDVRFCVCDEDLATAFTGESRTRTIRASRYAKASSLNVAAPVREQIPAAYVLPFAHNYVNYYHLVAEAAAGLRSIHRVADDVPIVYVEDRFDVLPFVFERLGLDPARLVSAAELETTQVACGYWPDPPPYLWARWVYDFFAGLGAGEVDRRWRRVYLSRARSVRSFANEAAVEEMMAGLGFAIVYAEELSVAEQARVFGAVDIVVAPHGAGLTNLVFCRPGTRVVELFPDTYVKPDFYLRSKHLDADYRAMVVADDTVDLSLLSRLVGAAERPWAPHWLASWA
ncbi:uncharacterized protein DUF563 [Nocardioides albertanoniae]|uniref:Uncharacterized protein DUF563 n=1 Tax=Nocardioides albertanoniae TaxID=1175486 RepID=A0A543AA02_9ACTN|nr:glycosyltransferase family 61 protein [Nocardioides albertanoniae]TQL69432.1 uncharacterized protein DUF563 [Nocardioides albertanoniae]